MRSAAVCLGMSPDRGVGDQHDWVVVISQRGAALSSLERAQGRHTDDHARHAGQLDPAQPLGEEHVGHREREHGELRVSIAAMARPCGTQGVGEEPRHLGQPGGDEERRGRRGQARSPVRASGRARAMARSAAPSTTHAAGNTAAARPVAYRLVPNQRRADGEQHHPRVVNGLLDGGVGGGHRTRATPKTITNRAPATDTARLAPAITEMTAAIAPSVERSGPPGTPGRCAGRSSS